MAFDGNPHIFADHAPAQQPLVPGYTQGHLPHAIVDDTRLNLAALFLLSYRVRHSPGWGTNRHELARDFGFGEDSFYGAVKTLAAIGYMKRTSKRKGSIWFASENLDFSYAPPPAPKRQGYQCLPNEMLILEGNEAWRPLALLVFLNSQALNFALTAKRIANRFDIHVRTVRRLMDRIVKSGLASKGKIAGKSGYIRLKRRAEAAVTKGHQPDAEKGHQPDAEKGHQPDKPFYVKPLGLADALAMERLLAGASDDAPLALKTTGETAARVADVTRGSASATSSDCDDEESLPSVETKPKQQRRKKGARQKAISTKPANPGKPSKPSKPERRAWVAVLDAEGEDVIQRLKANDRNGILHDKLFRYAGLQELAAMLDKAGNAAWERYGAEFTPRARNAAVEAITGKLCGWNTCVEKERHGVRSWSYFAGAVRDGVEIAMEEMRHAA